MHTAPHTAMPAMQPRFDCGHTGHEMLCGFGLINMNGRLYDPGLQRFLSPDNLVQAPENGQNYNRYSYCLNNPLRYADPSGWQSQPVITLPGGLSFYTLEDYHAYLRSLDHETTPPVRERSPYAFDDYGTSGIVSYLGFQAVLSEPSLSNNAWMTMSRPGGFDSFVSGEYSITQTENYRCTGYYDKNGVLQETHRELVSTTYDIKTTSSGAADLSLTAGPGGIENGSYTVEQTLRDLMRTMTPGMKVSSDELVKIQSRISGISYVAKSLERTQNGFKIERTLLGMPFLPKNAEVNISDMSWGTTSDKVLKITTNFKINGYNTIVINNNAYRGMYSPGHYTDPIGFGSDGQW